MRLIHSQGKLPGLKTLEIDFCEDCVFGKHSGAKFATGGRSPKPGKL